jgi:phospholipid/cholesterol/gamma-HCH transport system substrate-binding protein
MSEFYQDQRRVEIRVGIIVVVCVLILVLGYAWLRNTLQLRSMTTLEIRFASAQGIEVGDKVTVNGMEAGRVARISQLADGVLISTRIRLKHPIRCGARYIIQDSNLMGGKQLEIINSPAGAPIDTRQIQLGENSYGMTALLSTAAVTMEQVGRLLTDMSKSDGLFSQIRTTFNETQNTFGKVNATLDDSKENLNTALEQIAASATRLNELIAQSKPDLEKTLKMTPDLIGKVQTTLDSLQNATSLLQSAIRDMSQGKGTLQSMLNDDTLYKNLLSSSAKLDSLLLDIKKHPRRYFKLEVF